MSSSGSSQISTKEIESIIDSLKNHHHRGSTKKSYSSVWKNFNEFFVKLDQKPRNREDHIALYVGYLINANKQSSMVKCYISAIKAVLENAGIEVNADHCLLSSLTRTCKMVNDNVRTRLPIQKSLLVVLLAKVEIKFATQPYLNALFQAIFSTAYFGLFRVGEFTSSPHAVKVIDVHIGINKQKILFILRSSKTHSRSSPPQKIKISTTELKTPIHKKLCKNNCKYCPYKLLHNYLRIRP